MEYQDNGCIPRFMIDCATEMDRNRAIEPKHYQVKILVPATSKRRIQQRKWRRLCTLTPLSISLTLRSDDNNDENTDENESIGPQLLDQETSGKAFGPSKNEDVE